jgi:uncharacterized membrane protein (DUF373 family)
MVSRRIANLTTGRGWKAKESIDAQSNFKSTFRIWFSTVYQFLLPLRFHAQNDILKGIPMHRLFDKFEQLIVLILMAFMMIAVLLSTVEVGVILWKQMLEPPLMLLNVKEMMEVFGFILMVVIGLELLETIKAYLDKRIIHVEVVLLVALVAVARKIIILDYKEITPQMLFAVASLILSLSVGYFVVKRALDGRTSADKDA